MDSFWVAESAGPSGRRKGKRLDQARQKRHETQGTRSHGWRKRKGGKIRDGDFQRMQQVVIWVDWVPGYDAATRDSGTY
ncbi:uncharacterized protein BO88DRAFT_451806 [Aspergillus vadensis CBS 113365]|uniref:Uncharacterized protein n=1 Tax=Aspergillus vadensis (strain CBS 113365 / IMI 142717 / IBT 24658) TaxID=1448311 RepID=A0A319BYY2_ASPVC|nr:hypothetical protein BO88DRAFT_451806 [Aspergillus vadensis CBS 113365]PYH71123.1 hypothetical protein BO88DRAFT_451806 [Aspergillus vadensis CBS 113365]